MTVKSLHKDIIQRGLFDQDEGTNKHLITDATPPGKENFIVGVDVMNFLFAAVTSKSGAESYHTLPPVRNEAALSQFKQKHRVLIANNISTVVYVFDGALNPLKTSTNIERNKDKNTALTKLRSLLKYGRPQSLDDVTKQRKLSATVSPGFVADVVDFIKSQENAVCIQGPCEAEQQLVALELANSIDAILSEDGDNLILGAKTMISRVSYNYSSPKKSTCCIYKASEIWKRESAGGGRWTKDWLPELSCFLGNDYMTNLYGFGPVTVRKALDEYIELSSSAERRSFLENLERTKFWTESDKAAKKTAVGFVERFERVSAFIRHAPVYKLKSCNSSSVDIQSVLEDNVTVCLEPLNPLPAHIPKSDWGNYIGWPRNPDCQLPTNSNMKDIFVMSIDARTGEKIKQLEYPNLDSPPYYRVAFGSYLDFKACPVALQPDSNLKRFLFVRGLAPKGKIQRSCLVKLVQEVLKLERTIPGSTARPRQLSQLKLDSASYQVMESLKPRANTTKLIWSSTSDQNKALLKIRELARIDDTSINQAFGNGRNGIRYRAICRISGGNYDVNTLQCCPVAAETTDGNVDATAIRMKATPSMKADDYWVYLVFEDRPNGRLLSAPNSRCECPAGSLFCSHMLGLLTILYVIQNRATWTLEDLSKALPEPIKSVVKTPIPWSFVFGSAHAVTAGKKRTRRDIDLVSPQAKRRRTPMTSPVGVEANLFCDTQDDATGGKKTTRCDIDLASPQAKRRRAPMTSPVGVEANIFCDAQDDAAESHPSDGDHNWDGSECCNNDVDEQQEEPEFDNCEYDDTAVERNAEDEFVEGDVDCKFLLCEEIDAIVRDGTSNEAGEAEYSEKAAYKVTLANIEKANANKLAGIGGPNESPTSKLKQLQMLERFYQLHELRKKKKKSVLSHYVAATKKARDRGIQQLETILASDSPPTIQMPPTRLEKIPLGTHVLADRGFASCSPFYPFLNSQVTPFFLDGRSQFTMEEVGADREKCKLRYASEAVFSRVWVLDSVRDKVERPLMRDLHHHVNLAHGFANLYQPFYKPGKGVFFADEEWQGALDATGYQNYIDFAVPQEYVDAGMADTSVLKDGKDFATDTIRANPTVTRALFSDKIKSSGGRIITWALPTGLVFEHTGLYLGRAPEMRLVELWGKTNDRLA